MATADEDEVSARSGLDLTRIAALARAGPGGTSTGRDEPADPGDGAHA